MNFYSYLFACAYWVSVVDLKEKSAPQEYAFVFVSVIDLLLFVVMSGLVNVYLGKNILSGLVVIMVSALIGLINYFLFLNGKRFEETIKKFATLHEPQFRLKRIGTMAMTFLLTGTLAVLVSFLNSLN